MWFIYVEGILFTLDVVLQIVAIALLYRDRKKEETNIRYVSYLLYVLLNWMAHWQLLLCISHIEMFLHGQSVDNRSAFSVSFKYDIPDSMAFWKTVKIA